MAIGNWYNDAIKEDASGNPILDDDGNTQRYWEDGADMQIEMEVDGPDGVPDNPGQVVWEKPVRTDMSANNNFNNPPLQFRKQSTAKLRLKNKKGNTGDGNF